MQKARRRTKVLRPLVDTRFQGLFHSLIQGSFHLSLTVLVHYRSLRSIQPYQMVLVDSDRISHVPPYSGYHYLVKSISNTGLSPSTVGLSNPFLLQTYANRVVLQPRCCRNNNGLGYFHFARHYYGNHFCFLFLRLLRCFSSARSPPCG